MKRMFMTTALSALVLSATPALAQQGAGAPKGGKAQQSMPNVSEFDKQMAQMQDNMRKMQEQMDQIAKTQDPEARQRLLTDHWATMRGNMQMMHAMGACCGMTGGHMMDGNMMGGHMMGDGMMGMMGWPDYAKLTPEQMKRRQYMMDRYMSMQQMMMDHMMQHQNWMMQPPR